MYACVRQEVTVSVSGSGARELRIQHIRCRRNGVNDRLPILGLDNFLSLMATRTHIHVPGSSSEVPVAFSRLLKTHVAV